MAADRMYRTDLRNIQHGASTYDGGGEMRTQQSNTLQWFGRIQWDLQNLKPVVGKRFAHPKRLLGSQSTQNGNQWKLA